MTITHCKIRVIHDPFCVWCRYRVRAHSRSNLGTTSNGNFTLIVWKKYIIFSYAHFLCLFLYKAFVLLCFHRLRSLQPWWSRLDQTQYLILLHQNLILRYLLPQGDPPSPPPYSLHYPIFSTTHHILIFVAYPGVLVGKCNGYFENSTEMCCFSTSPIIKPASKEYQPKVEPMVYIYNEETLPSFPAINVLQWHVHLIINEFFLLNTLFRYTWWKVLESKMFLSPMG